MHTSAVLRSSLSGRGSRFLGKRVKKCCTRLAEEVYDVLFFYLKNTSKSDISAGYKHEDIQVRGVFFLGG